MGWREKDLAQSVLGLLIFLLMIYESTGSHSHPPNFLPPKTKIVAPINHAAAPFIESHNSNREIIHSQGNQSPNGFHVPANSISPSHTNPPASQITDGGAIHKKTINGLPLTPQHAPVPSPRLLPFNTQNMPPDSHRIHQSISNPPGINDLNASLHPSSPFQAPMASQALLRPMKISKKRENNYAPHLNFQELIMPPVHPSLPFTRNNGRCYAPRYYEDYLISPSQTPIEISMDKRMHLAPSLKFDVFEMNPSASHASMPAPKPKRPYVEGPKIDRAPLSPSMKTKRSNIRHYVHPIYPQGHYLPPLHAPLSSSIGELPTAPLPAPTSPPSYIIWQIYSPEPSPSTTFRGKSWASSPQPKRALPPPPPNMDCGPMMCQPPLTNPSSGSPCACVLPIKIGLRLGLDLYTFFPLVSELAKEIATGIFMKQSQVRVTGANSSTDDSEKTDVLIDIVPLGKSFDSTTIFLTFEKFWQKHVLIQGSYFGDYVVLYVSYPGLPPSPPAPAYVDGEAYRSNNNARAIHPLAVDVRKQKEKHSGSLIVIIALSSFMALFSIIGSAWLLIIRNRKLSSLPEPKFQSSQHPHGKSSAAGTVPMNVGNRPSSTSASFSSYIATYTGSIITFTLAEIEKATSMFDDSRIIGEGGFGRVYQGTLEDGTMVAVKILKREDRQGEREFLAEVEMLSRLHHRNLVKLMGICVEENIRCLIYELIPNGSVESHLHGVDKDTSPLDWNSRVKIALGTARALAYLHEDSSPRVIHRDFKSSNILLELDFTAKVSDFGLARSAPDEGMEHVSTCAMGTFGYVDPEYAMTGHLLVKSDVYSYGVVLLELLTGRKPVDMSLPPGKENLVTWTRHLLTNIEGLKSIIDPALGANYPRNSVAKVAAIASMCVQPEVSNRPLMSEVVQALNLVLNESDEYMQLERHNLDAISMRDVEIGKFEELGQGPGRKKFELDGFHASSRFAGDTYSVRRYSSSGPLQRSRSGFLWQRVLASVSSSEHGFLHGFWSRTSG